jgi:hypothetical protein
MSGYLAAGLALVSLAIYLYNRITTYFENKAFVKAKQESDEKQKDYLAEVLKLSKEIDDAKLTYDINRRKLDSDSNPSK